MTCVCSWNTCLLRWMPCFRDRCAALSLSSRNESAPGSVIADSLINELAELEREFILVLDDVHDSTADIYAFLAALLRDPLPGLHLLLLTRQDPPLALGTLRAYDQLTEIRGQDLRFTTARGGIHGAAVATPVGDEALAVVEERTEGWAAGLRLAALMLRNGGDADRPAPSCTQRTAT